MKIDVSSSSNNICEFNEEDMTKNDFDGMAYSKIKTKDNSSKGSVNIDEQIKVGEEFYRDNNMLTLEQTQLKHDFKKNAFRASGISKRRSASKCYKLKRDKIQ